jgi:ribosomal protein S18 acetylase RimI-like enzyme
MSTLAAMAISVTPADGADAAVLAAVAAATFPLACPPSAAAEDVAAFIVTHLSVQCFGDYLTDPDRIVFSASDGDRIVGYTMLIRGVGTDPDIGRAVRQRPAVEVSKMYVLPSHHSTGAASALMQAGIDWARADGAAAAWLGVNENNARAQRFYGKHGFEVAGSRTFRLGAGTESDFVMVYSL